MKPTDRLPARGLRPLVILLAAVLVGRSATAQVIPCETSKLHTSDEQYGDDVGAQIKASGDVLLVGAGGGNKCYVFRRIGGAWLQEAELEPRVLSFGEALA